MIDFTKFTTAQSDQLYAARKHAIKLRGENHKLNPKLAGMIIGELENQLGQTHKLAFLSFVFGYTQAITSSTQLLVTESSALVFWADPKKIGSEWAYSDSFVKTLLVFKQVITQ